MPRRRVVEKRKILPDPKFQDRIVAKFINTLMREGKKSTGERIIYGAFAVVENRLKDDPLKVFKKALDNVKPVVEVKSRRVGGPPTRSRWRSARIDARRWQCAGSSSMQRPAARRRWWRSWPGRSSTLQTTAGTR